jgi:hypothetical protein
MDFPAVQRLPMTDRLNALLRRGRSWAFFYEGSRAAGRFAAVFLPVAVFLSLAEALRPTPPEFRRWVHGALVLASLAFAFFKRTRGAFSRRSVLLSLGAELRPADRLLNLWELLPAGGGDPFLTRESSLLVPALPELRPSRLLRPTGWGRDALSAAALLSLLLLPALIPSSSGLLFSWRRVVWPWGAEASWVDVSPGDRRVRAGEDVAVVVRARFPSEEAPVLFVRGEKTPWEERRLVRTVDGGGRCVLERVVEPILYRARYRGLWTRMFRLIPRLPARFERVSVRVTPPAYTGLPEASFSDVLSLRAPAGSRVEGEGRLDPPVRSVALSVDGGTSVLALSEGRNVRFGGTARRSGPWVFRTLSAEGDADEILLTVDVTPDEPPSLRLLSPEGDAVLEPRERLPVVYEASDDHGLARLFLSVHREGKPDERRALPVEAGVREEVLSPARLGLLPGESAAVWLEAEDGNPAGPGKARTAAFMVKAVSHEQDRRRRDEALERWREALLAAKTDEDLIRRKLAAAQPDWAALAERQKMAGEGLRELTEKLESLANESAADLSADPWLAAEERATAEGLRALLQGPLPSALSDLNAGRRDPAASALDEVIDELDRASSALEEAQKSARARALAGQEAIADAAGELAEGLGKALTPEARRKMDAVMAEIAQGLAGLAEALQKTPGLLPDAPAGTDPSKVLKMSDMLDNLRDAKEAMDRGDAEAAERAARRLLDQVRQMQEILARGARRAGGESGGMSAALSEEMRRAIKDLRALADGQESLMARTQGVRDAALLRLKAQQEAVLTSTSPAVLPSTPTWSEEDGKALSAASADQSALKGRAEALRSSLEAARRKTSLIPAKTLQRLSAAAAAMETAAAALGERRPSDALPSQAEALRLLRDDADAMENAGGAAGGLGASGGGRLPGSGLPFPGGVRPNGPTRLPRAEDFRPPAAYREELLKALDEKYPRRDERLIEDYFKRWKK